MFILWYGTAPRGARLPGSADWSIANQLNWRFDGRYAPALMLSHTYLSEGISDLNSAVPGVASGPGSRSGTGAPGAVGGMVSTGRSRPGGSVNPARRLRTVSPDPGGAALETTRATSWN